MSFELLCFLYRNNAKIFGLARFDAENIICNAFTRNVVRFVPKSPGYTLPESFRF